MARREHSLTTPLNIDDATGSSTEFGLVRIVSMEDFPPQRKANVLWEFGRDNGGSWEAAGSKHRGNKTYSGADYDTLHGLSSSGASEEHMAKVEDQIYQDLVSDGAIGSGTQQDYSF